MQAKLFRQGESFLQPVDLFVPLHETPVFSQQSVFHLLWRKFVCLLTEKSVCLGCYRLEAW